jgi:hypothetical protein
VGRRFVSTARQVAVRDGLAADASEPTTLWRDGNAVSHVSGGGGDEENTLTLQEIAQRGCNAFNPVTHS